MRESAPTRQARLEAEGEGLRELRGGKRARVSYPEPYPYWLKRNAERQADRARAAAHFPNRRG